MTLLAAVLPVPPMAAVETGLFLFVSPLILLMAVWAVITAVRILYPEGALPVDPASRRARQRGEAVPVRLRQIVEEQRRSPAPVLPPRVAAVDGEPDARAEAIEAALWARRN